MLGLATNPLAHPFRSIVYSIIARLTDRRAIKRRFHPHVLIYDSFDDEEVKGLTTEQANLAKSMPEFLRGLSCTKLIISE